MSYIGNSPGVASQRVVTPFTATAGQTTFTPTSGYTLGYCDVFLNGVKLANGDDYSATDGATVVLASGAFVGDFVEVIAYFPRGLSDGYLKAEADARFPRVDTALQGLTSTQQGNARANINAVSKSGDTLTGLLALASQAPVSMTNGGANGIYDKTMIYHGQNNTSNDSANGIFIEMGRLTDNSNAEIRRFVIGGRGGNKNFELDGVGNIYPAGNLVLANGKGIDFSATADAAGKTSELFDDYEVGTWTPIYVQAGSNPTVSYTGTFGIYRKIGSLVWISGRICTTSVSGGSGMVSLGGLPYTVANVGNDNSALTIGVSFSTWNTNAAPAAGYPTTNTTTIQLATYNGADPRNGLDARINSLNASSAANGIVFSCLYIAA